MSDGKGQCWCIDHVDGEQHRAQRGKAQKYKRSQTQPKLGKGPNLGRGDERLWVVLQPATRLVVFDDQIKLAGHGNTSATIILPVQMFSRQNMRLKSSMHLSRQPGYVVDAEQAMIGLVRRNAGEEVWTLSRLGVDSGV